MKKISILLALLPFTIFAQELTEGTMSMSNWLGIWDNSKPVPAFNIQAIGYNDLPRDVFYRGIIVECLEFDDANGHNILLLTQTGMFPVSEKNEAGEYEKVGDRAEINAYLFARSDEKSNYKSIWKVADFQGCYDFDLYAGFTKKSLSITDVNADGMAEVSFQYTLSCRSDVSPADRKLYCFNSNEKFIFMGITTLEGMSTDEPTIEAKTEMPSSVKELMQQKWLKFEEDDFKQFSYPSK
ncbi:MAG: hypothetical protein A3D31_04250 [Candidatus Fluviicola riflensis]|nr:MAG: hypothetical protein CHH17_10780 [Candidatus Fluviicola riflensis]OGS79187.1 MAG: hypothetical protein A3D31_04250 [Candidatus Fluviicola riflensis]OGS86619.1 MAG: hypothetical protein A2724_03710 [Fluviicola sp. RIFCSPHIGHO2_01_FULL_43_53]OGS88907.1 MAG: hypothetical protein A3E30_00950 [Fluviicola sp. RIFCSPHIGHO2_12_FULL_43_24]